MRPPTSPEPPVDHAGKPMECPESRVGEIRNGLGSSELPAAQSDDRIVVPELGEGSLINRFAFQHVGADCTT